MRKLFVACLLALMLATPVIASERQCEPIWSDVAGQTYVIVSADQSFDIVFSQAMAGPCPQGVVEIYDGVYIAPVLTCSYMSTGNNTVVVDCGSGGITFLLTGDKLLMIDPDALFMLRK